MKKALVIALLAAVILGLFACSSQDKTKEEESKTEVKIEEPSNQAKEESTEAESVETAAETNSDPSSEDSEDDFQKGIPPEYRLKYNVEKGRDDPLPAPENNAGSDILKIFGNVGQPNSDKQNNP